MAAPVVGIVGAKALRRDLRRLTDDVTGPLYEAMKAAGRSVGEPIAAETRRRLPAGPRSTGRLQRDVRVSATRTGVGVRMGRQSVPYAGWVEFGGRRKQPHASVRPFVRTGRYLFPAARDDAERAAAAYSAALNRVLASSGVWTNTTANPGAVHD